jgi:hypothetical protein
MPVNTVIVIDLCNLFILNTIILIKIIITIKMIYLLSNKTHKLSLKKMIKFYNINIQPIWRLKIIKIKLVN